MVSLLTVFESKQTPSRELSKLTVHEEHEREFHTCAKEKPQHKRGSVRFLPNVSHLLQALPVPCLCTCSRSGHL